MGILLTRRAVCGRVHVCRALGHNLGSAGKRGLVAGAQSESGQTTCGQCHGVRLSANYLPSVSLLGGPCKVTASPGRATNLTRDNTSWACCGDGTTGHPIICC